MGFIDTGLAAGPTPHIPDASPPTPSATPPKPNAVTVTTATAGSVSDYARGVLDDGAGDYWRFGEGSGAPPSDWAGWSDSASATGVTRGTAGAITGDTNTASTFNGTTTGFAATADPDPRPGHVHAPRRGSRPPARTAARSSASATAPTGRVRQLRPPRLHGQRRTDHLRRLPGDTGRPCRAPPVLQRRRSGTTSSPASAPTAWCCTSTASGLAQRDRRHQRTGLHRRYWRIGGDNLGGWPTQPASSYFDGTIDDVAIYPTVLTADPGPEPLPGLRPHPQPARGAGRHLRQGGASSATRTCTGGWAKLRATTAADSGAVGNTGTYVSGVTLGRPGRARGT